MYRTRAGAGTGSARCLGASPVPGLREPARAAPRARKYRRAARLGCNGAQRSHVVRQQQPRALLEDTGLQSRPTTDGSTETPNADAHVCADGPISLLFPGPDQPPQSFNYELDRPGCDTRPLRRDMFFATGVDEVVLTQIRAVAGKKKSSGSALCTEAPAARRLGHRLGRKPRKGHQTRHLAFTHTHTPPQIQTSARAVATTSATHLRVVGDAEIDAGR
jgi:hypothetical protein